VIQASTCQRCGTAVSAGEHYCSHCGADVSAEQGQASTRRFTPMGTTAVLQQELLTRLRRAALGEYEILAELGRGGMASVFLAHDIQLDRRVAIKVMLPALVEGEGMAERFKLEARTAAGLSHPHIIPIYAVRDTDLLVYFVMKFVEGRPLDTILREIGKAPLPMVRSIISKVGDALGYAHRRGVVHRDIKPANLMIDTEGQPVVTDFGIAKVAAASGLTMTGATIGTPTYMSPEQATSGAITGASDQYSLGVVAYQMLTGHLPFTGDTVMSLMYAHCHEPPPPFMHERPDCPPELHAAVMRMLAKKPEDRFPDLESAVEAIGRVALAFNDPVQTQLVDLAMRGGNREIAEQIRTPRSPIVTRAKRTGAAAITAAAPAAPAAPVTPQPTAPQTIIVQSSPAPWIITGIVVVAAAVAAVMILKPQNASSPEPGPSAQLTAPAPTLPTPDPAIIARDSTAGAARTPVPTAPAATIAQGSARTPSQTPARTPDPRAVADTPDTAPVTVPSTTTPATGTDAPTSAPASAPASAPTSAPANAPVRDAAPPAPAPVVEAPRGPTPREGIDAAVAAYTRALESRQITDVRRAYPGMTAEQEQQLAQALRSMEQLDVTLDIRSVDIRGNDATALLSGTYDFFSRDSRRRERLPVNVSMSLEQGAGGWVIRQIRSVR
jgi:hypothetical protein